MTVHRLSGANCVSTVAIVRDGFTHRLALTGKVLVNADESGKSFAALANITLLKAQSAVLQAVLSYDPRLKQLQGSDWVLPANAFDVLLDHCLKSREKQIDVLLYSQGLFERTKNGQYPLLTLEFSRSLGIANP